MGQSSLAGGSLKRSSSCNSAAHCLHGFLCFGQCFHFRWLLGLQYLTSIHNLHALRLKPPPSSSCIVLSVMQVWYPPAADAEARSNVAAAVVMASTHWVTLPQKYDLGEYLSYEEIRHSIGTGLTSCVQIQSGTKENSTSGNFVCKIMVLFVSCGLGGSLCRQTIYVLYLR